MNHESKWLISDCLTDKHLNHKNNHKSKTNQVFVLSLLCGNKKSETFGEKNRYKSGEFEVVFFSEAIMEPTQELGLPFGRGMLPIAACFLGIRICQPCNINSVPSSDLSTKFEIARLNRHWKNLLTMDTAQPIIRTTKKNSPFFRPLTPLHPGSLTQIEPENVFISNFG